MTTEPMVIVHFEIGDPIPAYYVIGAVRLLIVDENAPSDRVYEITDRNDGSIVEKLIPAGATIGNAQDDRHAALANRILAAGEGRPMFTVVPKDPA